MMGLKGYFIILLIVTNCEIYFTHSSVLMVEHKIENDRTTNSDLFRAKRDLSFELCIKYGTEVLWGINNELLKMLSTQSRNNDENMDREKEKKKIEFCCKMNASSDCPNVLTSTVAAYNKSKEDCVYVIGQTVKCEDVLNSGSPVLASSSAIFIIMIISFYAPVFRVNHN
jgi:hypothetical protein